ncbi:MAG TPA: hypothetical protein VE861_09925 [Gemmatimonadaceae bacterium]|nr:hypothetical protein [Gemmatimonadaceae bacterium]
MTARHRLFVILASAALPSLAAAQQPVACTVTGPVIVRGYAADACQKATDLFSFIMPQFGQALSGGGAILGSANTLGGLGKFSFNVRVSAVQGRSPNLDDLTLSAAGAQRSQITTEESPVPAPVVDVGVGLYKGFPVGLTRMFSVDGIVNVAYLPDVDVEDLSVVVPDGRFKFGYGARVGITRDGPMMPAVSVSFIRRELPTADINASFDGGSGGTDQLSLTGFSVSTDALRASISKKFSFLEVGGGVGRDTYDTRLNIGAVVDEAGSTGTASYSYQQKVERNVVYGSLALNFPIVKVAAEVGQASGGTALSTYNTFVDGGQNEARRFASLGVRLSF